MTETREEHDVAGSIGDDPSTVSFAGTSVWRRLYYGETAIDFFGMRWKAIIASALLVVITGVSLFTRGLDLSLEFVGGVSWDVPAEQLTERQARDVLNEAGLDGDGARVQALTSQGEDRLKIQVEQQAETTWTVRSDDLSVDDARTALDQAAIDPDAATITEATADGDRAIVVSVDDVPDQESRGAVREALASAGGVDPDDVSIDADQTFNEVQSELAKAAGVNPDDVSVSSVSASWGKNVTRQAVKALVVFLVLVMVFIAVRFELYMALAALVALFHDVIVSVGVYSVFQFTVSPATVIAFLTILGYSLYDTIVVYDKIRENRVRLEATGLGYSDITNVSMNQVLMRSLNTSFSSILPVLALLIVGSWMLGATTLREFALALLIGMIAGVYSSIFIATPLLAMMRGGDRGGTHATGDELRYLVLGGQPRRLTARQRRTQRRTTRAAASGGRRGAAAGGASGGDAAGSPSAADDGEPAPPGDGSATETDDRTTGSPDTPGTPGSSGTSDASAASVLNHPPRPRKKKRH